MHGTSQLDDGVGKHCLVGHFLDGKMPLPLLIATACAVWKDFGRFTVIQLGACFLFEFDDEESKLKVLEGGPYFFSRGYLVLKEWKRMLVPSKIQPSTILVWIKLHRLPLEFWSPVGFSKIASAIGKPLHVDEATAKRKRLDFARICIEIDAKDDLPNDITISVNIDSVMVGVEYQWLPSKCEGCKVFGHTCGPKPASKESNPEDWLVVGKGKLTKGSTHAEAQSTIEGCTRFPTVAQVGVGSSSHPTGAVILNPFDSSRQPAPTNLKLPETQVQMAADTSSEEMDEEIEVKDTAEEATPIAQVTGGRNYQSNISKVFSH